MAIQVNIFEAGSVPTAQELATLINELNTTLDESVTLTGEQSITGVKTFLGSKLIKFKQSTSADKLGFTLYDYQGKEVGNFEYDNKNNFRLLALGNYVSAATQEVECNIGFKIYNKLQSAAYRLLCPLAGNAKNSIPSLTDTYTNFYMPLVFTNGAASVMADNNGKVDLSTLIGSGGGDTSDLATVATTGDYNDLLNKPILFSGNYNDLTNKPTLFSGSYGDLTDKPTLFSGDYNDLTNKPTIPTVPAISTNITNDATSDTKTASPKAVKDFVEGKGYLTEHQDISGKADQTDLEALEDRVETLEQGGSGGGDTTQYSYLKLIPDLDAYTEAPVGEIVKYTGPTNGKYTRGWDYEKVSSGEEQAVTIIEREGYPYVYTEQVEGLFGLVYGGNNQALLVFTTTPATNDKVIYWDENRANPKSATITSVSGDGFYIGENMYISLNDLSVCPLSKFVSQNNQTCLVIGSPSDLIPNELPTFHERFYFKNNVFEVIKSGSDTNASQLFVQRENFDVNVAVGSMYIPTIGKEAYPGPFYYTGKNNIYTIVSYYNEFDEFAGNSWAAARAICVGDTVFRRSSSGGAITGTTTVKTVGNSATGTKTKFNGDSLEYYHTYYLGNDLYEFANENGDLVYISKNILSNSPYTCQIFIPKTSEYFTATLETAVTTAPVAFTIGTPVVSWQPIIHPTAPVNSGD